MERIFDIVAALAAITMLLVAFTITGRHHHQFFLFLRVVVCMASAWLSYRAFTACKAQWLRLSLSGLLAFLALLYAPIPIVHLSRSLWLLMNSVAMVILIA
jgi:hypothetical protein